MINNVHKLCLSMGENSRRFSAVSVCISSVLEINWTQSHDAINMTNIESNLS